MFSDQLMFVGQKAVIEKNGSVLILQEPTIGLDLPGGKIDKKETDLQLSLQREVREETGLEITVHEPFYVSMEPIRNEKFKGEKLYLVYFTCKYVKGEVRLSNEHLAFSWVNTDNYYRLAEESDRYKALDIYFKHL